MPNGISRHYQLDESISNGSNLQFNSNFKSTFCEQTVQNLIRRRVMWRLIGFYIVCQCPINMAQGLNRLRQLGYE